MAVEFNAGVQLAARDAKAQRLEAQLAVVEHYVGIKIGERQFRALNDLFAGELDVGVHRAPAIGLELFDRQYLVGRLLAFAAAVFLLGVGVGANQRLEVSHQQLIGNQRTGQLGTRLTGYEAQIAMDVAVADLAVETLVLERRASGIMQLGDQTSVSGIRRRIRQGHAGQRIQIAQAVARKLQTQIQLTQVLWIGDSARDGHPRIPCADISLNRERQRRIFEREQPADLASAVEFLAMVLALGGEAEGIVLRRSAFVLDLLGFAAADDVAERNRLAQRIDHNFDGCVDFLIVVADEAFVETDRTDIHHPAGRLGVGIAFGQVKYPVRAAIGQAFDFGVGFGQVDTRNDHTLRQQRQRRQAHLDAFEGHHLRGLGPFGITERNVFSRHMRPRHPGTPTALVRLTMPVHCQIAVDGEGSVQLGRDLFIDSRLEPVPVESGDHDDQYGQQQQQNANCPGENLTASRHCVFSPYPDGPSWARLARRSRSTDKSPVGLMKSAKTLLCSNPANRRRRL